MSEERARFGASHAIISFVLVTFGQLTLSVGIAAMATFGAIAEGKNVGDKRVAAEVMHRAMAPSVIAGVVAAALITLAAMRILGGPLVRDRSPAGLGLFLPTGRQMLLWLAAGVAAGVAYNALMLVVPSRWEGGPMARWLRERPGDLMVVALVALSYAPVFEELLYRGLMLRGMLASWGVRAAGIVVTLLFFAMHLPETIGYWPAMLAILSIAVVTLLARLRTGSVVAAMLAHGGYNAVMVGAMLAGLRPPV